MLSPQIQEDSHVIKVYEEDRVFKPSAAVALAENPCLSGKTTRLNRLYIRWVRDWWAIEILSLAFSTLCITAIVIMLSQVDGKEMPRWKLGVTIDALLSLLSGFSKSCLLMPTAEAISQLKWHWFKEQRQAIDFEMMDKASRGTVGAVALLSRSRGV